MPTVVALLTSEQTLRSFDADRGAVVDCRATAAVSVVDAVIGDGWCSFNVGAHDVALVLSRSRAAVVVAAISVNVGVDGLLLF